MKAKFTLSVLLGMGLMLSANAQQLPRLLAQSYYGFDGTNYIPVDSARYGYTGTRGATPQKFMNAEFFDLSNDYADTFKYASGSWGKIARTTKTFDGSDNLTERIYQTINGSAWENERKVTIDYKANKPDSAFQDYWRNQSNDWRVYDKFGYTWNGNNVATITRIYWRFSQQGSGWRNSWNHILTYSGSNIASITKQDWDNSNTQWVNDTKDEHTYGADGLTETRKYKWNTPNNSWDYTDRTTVTYTGGKKTEMLEQFTTNGGSTWDNAQRYTYDYVGASTMPDTMTKYTWDPFSSLWANAQKFAYKYNSYGQVTEVSTQSWDGTKWAATSNDDLSRFYYEPHPVSVATTNPLEGAISVYPSPASTNLNVQVGSKIGDILNYTIIANNGAVVKSWTGVNTGTAQNISTDNMPAGNYYMTINDGKNITTKQFSVVK